MELVKDHAPGNSTLCLIQPHPFYENEFAEASVDINNASPGLTNYRIDIENQKKMFEEGSSSEKSTSMAKNFAATSPSSLSSPSSANSDGLAGNQAFKYQPENGHNSLINFDTADGYGHFGNNIAGGLGGSLFSFGRSQSCFPRLIMGEQDDYSVWEDNLQCSTPNPGSWLNSELANANAATVKNSIQDHGREEPCFINNKRPFVGESTQASKKQCNVAKTLKSKSTASASKDPQSVAAKNRRERISERLKILQELVPNGSKVDLVTMLEKAISYVKFLQLQVKVLATDEFWPAQGAKAPDLSQVKEAIDAILASSQRDRNSSSSKS